MTRLLGVFGSSGFAREVMPLVRAQAASGDRVVFVDRAAGPAINGHEVIDEAEFFGWDGDRLRAASVIDCAPEAGAIRSAIDTALAGDWSDTVNPYGDGQAALRIVSHLAAVQDPAALIRKSFEDLTHS